MPITVPLSSAALASHLDNFARRREGIARDRSIIAAALLAHKKTPDPAAVFGFMAGEYFIILGRPERVVLDAMEQELLDQALATMEDAAQRRDSYAYSIWFLIALMYAPLARQARLRLDLLQEFAWGPLTAAVSVNVSLVLDDVATIHRTIDFFADLFAKLASGTVHPVLEENVSAAILQQFRSVELTCSTTNLAALRGGYGRLAQRYLRRHGRALDWQFPPPKNGAPIHLAVLASYLDSHGHGLAAFAPLIGGLDRARFKKTLICLPSEVPAGWITQHRGACAEIFDTICTLDGPDAASIARLRGLNIDVLFSVDPYDTTLLGRPAEIAYHRVARRQVTAYFNNATTGIPAMDYLITSRLLDDPQIATTHFTERTVYIDPLPFCYDFDAYFSVTPEAISREDLGLPPDCKIMTCGNTILVKLRQEALEAYCRILKQVDNLYFVLMPGGALHHQENIFWQRFAATLTAMGVPPQRIVIVPDSSRSRQFGLVKLADLYLDFFPFAGANSILDPIYVGTPPVALNADYQLRCRQAAAILATVDCTELVAQTVPEFVALAVRVLTDADFSAAVTRKIGPDNLRRASVFDGSHSRQAFGAALQQIHEAA